jgi:hypothetical protein
MVWYDVSAMTPDGSRRSTSRAGDGSPRACPCGWSLARPVVRHIMRATLATVATDAEGRSR